MKTVLKRLQNLCSVTVNISVALLAAPKSYSCSPETDNQNDLTARQRLLDREKISPGQALLQRLAQEISGMQRRDRPDLARAGVKDRQRPRVLRMPSLVL